MELKGFSVCLICDLLTRASSQASLLSHSILPHSHRKCARVINLQRPVCSSDVITDEVLNHLIPQRTRPVASVLRVQSGSSPSVRPWSTNSSELVCSPPPQTLRLGTLQGDFCSTSATQKLDQIRSTPSACAHRQIQIRPKHQSTLYVFKVFKPHFQNLPNLPPRFNKNITLVKV